MGTTNIPLTTLPVGTRQFGPHTANNNDSSVILNINRDPSGGLNSLTSENVLQVEAQMSTDGGATWHAVDTDQQGSQTYFVMNGGTYTYIERGTGIERTHVVSSAQWPLYPGINRRLRAFITVSGPSSITVSGSIVTQLCPLLML